MIYQYEHIQTMLVVRGGFYKGLQPLKYHLFFKQHFGYQC